MGIKWGTKNEAIQGYQFSYDNLNRLLQSNYAEGNSLNLNTGFYSEIISGYDKNGNIQTLQRYYNNSRVDSLTYKYNTKTNYIRKVYDSGNINNAIDDYPGHSQSYEYDANGNMKKDGSKNINIYYNPTFNLPKQLDFGNSNRIFYHYTAGGVKLAKHTVPGGGTGIVFHYIGNIVYQDNTLSYIQTEEGRLVAEGTGTSRMFLYEYNIQDHLGNTRLSFMGTDMGGAVDLVQTTNYYPFGLVMSQTNGNTSPDYKRNLYLYNNKELQEDKMTSESLNWYDYGARFYDPQIGRFTTMDPMANKYYRWNPYCYVLNNPLKFIDSDGRLVEFAPGSSQEFKNKVAATINYMNAKGTSGFFNSLSESKSVYILQETRGGVNTFASNTISWNPNLAKITTEGAILSPATLFNHELDHANQSDSKPDQFKKDADLTTGKNTQYDTNEEERVIEGSEQVTAKKHGEIKDGEVTRKDHKMIGSVQVDDPTSTGIPSVNIVGNKKDADNTQSTQKKKDEKDQ